MISNRKLCRSSVCLCEWWAARGSCIFKDGFDKSKLDVNALLDNQSLLASITACAWYRSASRPLTSEASAAFHQVHTLSLSSRVFLLDLVFGISSRLNPLRLQLFTWTVLRLEIWNASQTHRSAHSMLVFGLVTCRGLFCLYGTGENPQHFVFRCDLPEARNRAILRRNGKRPVQVINALCVTSEIAITPSGLGLKNAKVNPWNSRVAEVCGLEDTEAPGHRNMSLYLFHLRSCWLCKLWLYWLMRVIYQCKKKKTIANKSKLC